MKVAITGTSGLAKVIKDKLEGQDIEVSTPRVEDLTMNGTNWWGFDYDNPFKEYISVKDKYKDTIIDKFYNHDCRDGPLKKF